MRFKNGKMGIILTKNIGYLNQTLYKILEYLAASETRVKRLASIVVGQSQPKHETQIKQELELLKNEPLKV